MSTRKIEAEVLAFSQRYSQFAFAATLLNTALLLFIILAK